MPHLFLSDADLERVRSRDPDLLRAVQILLHRHAPAGLDRIFCPDELELEAARLLMRLSGARHVEEVATMIHGEFAETVGDAAGTPGDFLEAAAEVRQAWMASPHRP